MTQPSWLWLVGLALVLLFVGFAMGSRRREGRDLMSPPPPAPRSPLPRHPVPPAPFLVVPPDARARIAAALQAGNKIEAIKLMREATGMGLAEAKTAVEAMATR